MSIEKIKHLHKKYGRLLFTIEEAATELSREFHASPLEDIDQLLTWNTCGWIEPVASTDTKYDHDKRTVYLRGVLYYQIRPEMLP